MSDGAFDLSERPLHLGLGATAVVQPPNDGVAWYTADAAGPVTVLFITAGEGTQHRKR